MEKLVVVVAEASLELVPRELWGHPAIYKYARRRGKPPGEILLDHALHHQAMKEAGLSGKRGRPDIVHLVLHAILSSPLALEGLLELYVHTIEDYVIAVDPSTRLPRNYMLFTGLMEQLLTRGQVPPDSPKPFMKVRPQKLSKLLENLPRPRILVTYLGDYAGFTGIVERLAASRQATLVLPGFPAQEDYSSEAYSATDQHLNPYRRARLDPWTLASHLLALLAHRLGVIR